MTIIHQDGMDLYTGVDLALEYTVLNTGVNTTGGRFGGGCASLTNYNFYFARALGAAYNELWIAGAISLTDASPNDTTIMQVISASGIECTLTYNPATAVFKAWRGSDGGTLLGSVSKQLTSGYHWLELHYKYDSSAGIFELWLDNGRILNLTAQNTAAYGSSGGIITVSWGDIGHNTSMKCNWDDVMIIDPTASPNAGRLGDTRIYVQEMASDAGPNQGTPLSGTSHFAMVDEVNYNTATYITLPNTSGDKEVFGVGALPTTPAQIWGVKVTVVAEKSDAGSYGLNPLVVSNGVESDGTSVQLQTTYNVASALFQTDPNTSAAWTYAAVNAMNVGVKVT